MEREEIIECVLPENNEQTNYQKNQIRQTIRALKNQLSEVEKQKEADTVFSSIEQLQEFKTAKTILLYWSTSDELPTQSSIEKWSIEKDIFLPSVASNELNIKEFTSTLKMKSGNLGIWEPDTLQNYTGNIDLIIVPGVAFDFNKNRLGRGKGFYDRFLLKTNALKIGVGFNFQLMSVIPTNENDIRMDKVFTSSKIIH